MNKLSSDCIVDIYQNFCEMESVLKIIKESIFNENKDITMNDIGNALEIIVSKMRENNHSLNIFIDEN